MFFPRFNIKIDVQKIGQLPLENLHSSANESDKKVLEVSPEAIITIQ